MPMCSKCSDLHKSIARTLLTSGRGSNPSTLELAYMVNLEYYIDMKYDCVHAIPENDKASIKIKDMVEFIDGRKWELTTRTNYNGFKSSTFVNRPAKQVVVIHRGTENWEQVKADIMLAMDIVTPEVIQKANWHTTQSLLNNGLKEEGNKFVRNDFSITITGPSLGGWLAQVCTLISKYPKFHPTGPRGVFMFGNGKSLDMNQSYDLHCVAFDSPGASTVLNRMETTARLASWLSGRKRDVEDALKTLDINVYLSNRNPVNLCGTHVIKVQRIDVMKDTWFWQRANPFASHSMERILGYFQQHSNSKL